jgi:hypothetical protein
MPAARGIGKMRILGIVALVGDMPVAGEAGSTHLVGYSHNLNQHTQANQKGDYGKRE